MLREATDYPSISKRSQMSTNMQRRKLNIEIEKARQKLEQEQSETVNQIRLMKHGLEQQEIIANSNVNTNDQVTSIETDESVHSYRIKTWLNNSRPFKCIPMML